MFAGFKAARRAYDEHETVLELDPPRKDAGLVVGTYRYVVSTLSLPLRMMAYVVGFGGGTRARASRCSRKRRPQATETRTDALFALVLIYNRERRYDEALQVLKDLRQHVSAQPAGGARSGLDGACGPAGPTQADAAADAKA